MNFFSEVLCNFASDSSLVWNVLSGRGPYEPLWAFMSLITTLDYPGSNEFTIR